MTELPKNFPEYSLMYKTLNNKIRELKDSKEKSSDPLVKEQIEEKIEKFQKESNRIKSLFPENFFTEN